MRGFRKIVPECLRSHVHILGILVAAFLWFGSPWNGQPAAVMAAESMPPPVSYHRQIRPILQANCQGCRIGRI